MGLQLGAIHLLCYDLYSKSNTFDIEVLIYLGPGKAQLKLEPEVRVHSPDRVETT